MSNRRAGVEPAEARHLDVEADQIGTYPVGYQECGNRVVNPLHLEAELFTATGEKIDQFSIVIGQQNGSSFHDVIPLVNLIFDERLHRWFVQASGYRRALLGKSGHRHRGPWFEHGRMPKA